MIRDGAFSSEKLQCVRCNFQQTSRPRIPLVTRIARLQSILLGHFFKIYSFVNGKTVHKIRKRPQKPLNEGPQLRHDDATEQTEIRTPHITGHQGPNQQRGTNGREKEENSTATEFDTAPKEVALPRPTETIGTALDTRTRGDELQG